MEWDRQRGEKESREENGQWEGDNGKVAEDEHSS